ncbi:DMT family transporter [Desulfofustis glycolicus]|uniref:Threonine/homoserine efflux transporter RhtA n=1 Tax=Desulfofustis glycolicus DSM 9705 TaxID=1121409 RepID=A0A1M5YIR8_9BACT|nr:DMT family transporter [Desulfofustis glycolicus]MCB2218567.1 DMT family transporter [Desulfobulbaceae bacterium]SHI11832.1 Threonine/homoserine efflux transporter RhtA [Desulfofustis glycolicus DSM 9705]
MNTQKAYLKYATALLLFGLNGIVASHIHLSSSEIVFTRTLIGSLFLIILFALGKKQITIWNNRKHLSFLVISGVAMGASWLFLFEAYRQIGVSIATLAYYCGPVIVMAVSIFVFKEKATTTKLFGFLAVILGMLFLNGEGISQGSVSHGLIYGAMSAIMYAIMVVFNRKAGSITGLENAMWQLLVSFLTVAVFVLLKQGLMLSIRAESLPPILILGIINTGLGCYLYFSSIGELPVQTVAISGYLEPLSALIFSAILLGENLSVIQGIGAMLILGGAVSGELSHQRHHDDSQSGRRVLAQAED